MNRDNRRQATHNCCTECGHPYSKHAQHLYSEDAVHPSNTLVIMHCMKCGCLITHDLGEGR